MPYDHIVARIYRSRCGLFLALSVAVAMGRHAAAQTQSPLPAATSTSSSSNEALAGNLSLDNPDANGPSSQRAGTNDAMKADTSPSLSTRQIVAILQENPDLAVELKQQVADRLQSQGTQVSPDDISDEMLYGQINSNANLRASLSTYLQARGYVSSDDLPADSSDGEMVRLPSSQSSFTGTRSAIDSDSLDDRRRPDSRSATSLAYPQAGTVATRSTTEPRRSHEETNAATDTPKVLRQPAPYNLQSMRDLYTQIPESTAALKRFGSDVFTNRDIPSSTRGLTSQSATIDVPIGPDYVLGPGDTLTISVWGGVTETFNREIGRDGRLLLPEGGSFQVAGLTLQKTEALIADTLKRQLRDAQLAVTVAKLRSVRVYVVGDVQRPGGYEISSLATPLSVLYAAGGPTAVGSLRIARHMRGKQLVEDIDLYDFILRGVRSGAGRFESGDTLLVPPAGPQVAVSGAVKRPAIYELAPGESTLAGVIADAGGFTAAASTAHITIQHIDVGGQRVTTTLGHPGAETLESDRAAIAIFPITDGDRIRVAPILPYSQRAVYLEGHVARPGRVSYSDGMRLSDVIRSYQDLLPEPAARGALVRLVAPDLHAETISFDVIDVLAGNTNATLQPFDTIRIYGRYAVDAPKVTIQGEVLWPSTYPLSQGMTAAQLVRMAGGFKRDALLDSADLTSYDVTNGNQVLGSIATIAIGAAINGSAPQADVLLKPGDVLTIRQITGWNDIGASVKLDGQVRYPGTYGIREGERLSSVLKRAGGLVATAYAEGSVLEREQVRELEEKSRQELIRQIEANSATARLSPDLAGGDTAGTLQLIKAQQEETLTQLKNHPPTGRLVVHISADIDSWANTDADIEVRRDDTLTIPKRPGFVLVTGQVYNATALTYVTGKTAAWYLGHAGGTNTSANRKEIFVIRANGTVIGRHSGGMFDPKVLSTKLEPGDVVVVPQRIIGTSLFWKNLLTAAQLASSIAITAAVAQL